MAMPRRPSSSGIRSVARGMGGELDAVPSRPGLDTVGNGDLHAVEKEKAAEKNESDGTGGSKQEQAGGLAAAGDSPADAVNDAGHGIEAIEPAPARGHERRCVGNGRGEHPEGDDEGDDGADVAVGPDFAEAQLEEAARRLDTDGRRATGMNRERSGLW